MPVTTRAQGRALLRSTMDSISHPDVLALIFQRLPPMEQCITVSRLSRQWHEWSQQQSEPPDMDFVNDLSLFKLPLWCIRESWGGLTLAQRDRMALQCVFQGDLPAVRFVVEEAQHTFTADWCQVAAARGQPDVLQYLRAAGCPWNSRTCREAAKQGLELLQWAHENGCPWDSDTTLPAALAGRVDILRYVHELGCPLHEQAVRMAVEHGHLEVLQYAVEHGCPWDEATTSAAAAGGGLDVLRWAVERGCPWHERTCSVAAMVGRLDILRFAREHGCPWDPCTCYIAAARGDVEVLRWAVEHGCPMNLQCCRLLVRPGSAGYAEILRYLDTLPAE